MVLFDEDRDPVGGAEKECYADLQSTPPVGHKGASQRPCTPGAPSVAYEVDHDTGPCWTGIDKNEEDNSLNPWNNDGASPIHPGSEVLKALELRHPPVEAEGINAFLASTHPDWEYLRVHLQAGGPKGHDRDRCEACRNSATGDCRDESRQTIPLQLLRISETGCTVAFLSGTEKHMPFWKNWKRVTCREVCIWATDDNWWEQGTEMVLVGINGIGKAREKAATLGALEGLDTSQAPNPLTELGTPASNHRPEQRRDFCPVPGCPDGNPFQRPGWLNTQDLKSHLQQHADGEREGGVSDALLNDLGWSRCGSCGQIEELALDGPCQGCQQARMTDAWPLDHGGVVPYGVLGTQRGRAEEEYSTDFIPEGSVGVKLDTAGQESRRPNNPLRHQEPLHGKGDMELEADGSRGLPVALPEAAAACPICLEPLQHQKEQMDWHTGYVNGTAGHRFHTQCIAGTSSMLRGASHARTTGELESFLADNSGQRDATCPLCRDLFAEQGDTQEAVSHIWEYFQRHPELIPAGRGGGGRCDSTGASFTLQDASAEASSTHALWVERPQAGAGPSRRTSWGQDTEGGSRLFITEVWGHPIEPRHINGFLASRLTPWLGHRLGLQAGGPKGSVAPARETTDQQTIPLQLLHISEGGCTVALISGEERQVQFWKNWRRMTCQEIAQEAGVLQVAPEAQIQIIGRRGIGQPRDRAATLGALEDLDKALGVLFGTSVEDETNNERHAADSFALLSDARTPTRSPVRAGKTSRDL